MSLLSSRILHVSQLINIQNGLNRMVLAPAVNVSLVRNYAARKGTRERKQKKKVKVEVQKIGFIPHNLRDREKLMSSRPSKKVDDSWKPDPTDNVYPLKYYKWTIYPFAEAIHAHRETHHPEMYNMPNAEVHVTIELNMQGEKKTKYVENFKRIAAIPHKYDHGEDRSIIAFAKTEECQKEAISAGAQLSGGVDLIKKIQNGQVMLQDFQYVVSHPDILPELVVLRGVMKKKFPNPKAGTLDLDMGTMVDRFLRGINYQAIKDEYEKDFGHIDAVLGTLNMDETHLEENFAALIRDINSQKPKRIGSFITRSLIWSPPSREKFKIDFEMYINNQSKSKSNIKEEVEAERIAL